MSAKVLQATCAAGLVTAGELPLAPPLPLATAQVLSMGLGPSTGFVVIDGFQAYYVTSSAPDLSATLDGILSALGEIRQALQAIASGPITLPGDTAGPTHPSLATALGGHATAITALEAQLTTLKGALR